MKFHYKQIELKNAIRKGIWEGQPFITLYTYLVNYQSDGGDADSATLILTELRAECKNKDQDDRLLELLDITTGWCAPHIKIWN